MKGWTVEKDIFLVVFEGMGANYIANHDLGFQSKNAGIHRIKKLKESGVYDKILAYERARNDMNDAWVMSFGPDWAKEIVEDRSKEEDFPWIEHGVCLAENGTTEFYSSISKA